MPTATRLISYSRRAPDPVALVDINSGRRTFVQDDHAAIVRFVPADGIEHKLAISGPAIMQRLAVDDVVRQLFHELWRERVEGFGIFSVCEPITFERNGDAGQIH